MERNNHSKAKRCILKIIYKIRKIEKIKLQGERGQTYFLRFGKLEYTKRMKKEMSSRLSMKLNCDLIAHLKNMIWHINIIRI